MFPFAISTSKANVFVVYNGDGHLLLEVNSELLSEDASQELEKQFGELILKDRNQGENQDENRRESKRKGGVCGTSSFTFATRKRTANLRRRTSNK